jgi:hypothetical protein
VAKRLAARSRAPSGEGGGRAQDEVSLPRVGRRPDLGQVPRRPPDRSGLSLRRASPGEHEQREQRAGERQPRELRHRGHHDVGVAGLYGRKSIAVGTAIAGGPPHRSQRAELPHWAPPLGFGSGVESLFGIGVLDAGGW